MPFCVNCGHNVNFNARFCEACGTPTDSNQQTDNCSRKHEYAGKIIKCPACGEAIPSMTALCPSCGHEINSAKVSSSLSTFIDALKKVDNDISHEPKTVIPNKGWKTWGTGKKTLWIILNILTSFIPLVIYLVIPLIRPLFGRKSPPLSPCEQQKVSIIEDFVFPNEREAILEALFFIKAKMAFLSSEKYTPKIAFWMNLWNTKAEQLYTKASILLKNESLAEATYNEILQSRATVEKRTRNRAIISFCIATIFTVYVLLSASLIGKVGQALSRITLPDIDSSYSGSEKDDHFEWLNTGLCTLLPSIDSNDGHYWSNSDTELNVRVEDISYTQFDRYITQCKEMGFTLNSTKDTSGYTAYNAEGYYLDLQFWGYSGKKGPFDIKLLAPLKGDENFVWPSGVLADFIPITEYDSGRIDTNLDNEIEIHLYEFTKDRFDTYVDLCKHEGFTIDGTSGTLGERYTYEAYNNQGYKIYACVDNMKELTVIICAPKGNSPFSWPASGPATMLPKADNCIGEISVASDWSFSAYITNMTIDEYNDYVEECISFGFEEDRRSEHYFSANKGKNISISVDYVGFNTVYISITDYDKF